MANRVAGSGPVYENAWFTKENGVKGGATITRGDIVTVARNASEKVNTNDYTGELSGYAQALETVTAGAADGSATVQVALAGSAIRMPVKGAFVSGQKAKLDVTSNVQRFEAAAAADVAGGRAIATFLHAESSDLTANLSDGDIGVFLLD